jgi:hypothetical protein
VRAEATIREPTVEQWRAAIVDRRDHWRQNYLQGTNRAHHVVSVAGVVGAMAVALLDWEQPALSVPFVVQAVAVLASAVAVWLASAAAFPPVGRHLVGFPVPGGLLRARRAQLAARVGCAPADLVFADRRPDLGGLRAFASTLVLPLASTVSLDLDDPAIRADLYLAWGVWYVSEQLGALLRHAVRAELVAMPLVAVGWWLGEVLS